MPSAWLRPGKEFTINRVGDNDITVVVDDGREIDGDPTGSILQIPGRADYKVLDDNTIVLTSALPHNAGGQVATITTQTADDLAAIDVSGLALGTIATVSNDTPDNNGPYSLALDGAITYWSA